MLSPTLIFRNDTARRLAAFAAASLLLADFVAKVGYGGWMPVSHSTIDDRL
jgi:hypothetical protein